MCCERSQPRLPLQVIGLSGQIPTCCCPASTVMPEGCKQRCGTQPVAGMQHEFPPLTEALLEQGR
jgi:hypothetical protein